MLKEINGIVDAVSGLTPLRSVANASLGGPLFALSGPPSQLIKSTIHLGF